MNQVEPLNLGRSPISYDTHETSEYEVASDQESVVSSVSRPNPPPQSNMRFRMRVSGGQDGKRGDGKHQGRSKRPSPSKPRTMGESFCVERQLSEIANWSWNTGLVWIAMCLLWVLVILRRGFPDPSAQPVMFGALLFHAGVVALGLTFSVCFLPAQTKMTPDEKTANKPKRRKLSCRLRARSCRVAAANKLYCDRQSLISRPLYRRLLFWIPSIVWMLVGAMYVYFATSIEVGFIIWELIMGLIVASLTAQTIPQLISTQTVWLMAALACMWVSRTCTPRMLEQVNLVCLCVAQIGTMNWQGRSAWIAFIQRHRFRMQAVRAEELLTLLMPRVIAHRLLQGDSFSHNLDKVCVVFIYVQSYRNEVDRDPSPEWALKPTQALHNFYKDLDDLIVRHDFLYKIENIENTYLLAGGVVQELRNRPKSLGVYIEEAVCFAYEAIRLAENKGSNLSLKVGVCSGPACAAIIGKSRTFFRLFGDTVNTASRMGSLSEPGMVQVCPTTAKHLQYSRRRSHHFTLSRKRLDVKGKGSMYGHRVMAIEPEPCRRKELFAETVGKASAVVQQSFKRKKVNRTAKYQRALAAIHTTSAEMLQIGLDDAVWKYWNLEDPICNLDELYVSKLELSYIHRMRLADRLQSRRFWLCCCCSSRSSSFRLSSKEEMEADFLDGESALSPAPSVAKGIGDVATSGIDDDGMSASTSTSPQRLRRFVYSEVDSSTSHTRRGTFDSQAGSGGITNAPSRRGSFDPSSVPKSRLLSQSPVPPSPEVGMHTTLLHSVSENPAESKEAEGSPDTRDRFYSESEAFRVRSPAEKYAVRQEVSFEQTMTLPEAESTVMPLLMPGVPTATSSASPRLQIPPVITGGSLEGVKEEQGEIDAKLAAYDGLAQRPMNVADSVLHYASVRSLRPQPSRDARLHKSRACRCCRSKCRRWTSCCGQKVSSWTASWSASKGSFEGPEQPATVDWFTKRKSENQGVLCFIPLCHPASRYQCCRNSLPLVGLPLFAVVF